jgi:hypothetical protein
VIRGRSHCQTDHRDLRYLRDMYNLMCMNQNELAYVEKVGRFFSTWYGVAPVFGRLAGWLLICEPPQQTIDEIAAALHASRSAISGGVAILEKQSWIVRTRAAGERADRIAMNPRTWDASLESPEFSELAALANEGLDALRGSPSARTARLREMAAFGEFLRDRMPELAADWVAHRDALRASGELPDGPAAATYYRDVPNPHGAAATAVPAGG